MQSSDERHGAAGTTSRAAAVYKWIRPCRRRRSPRSGVRASGATSVRTCGRKCVAISAHRRRANVSGGRRYRQELLQRRGEIRTHLSHLAQRCLDDLGERPEAVDDADRDAHMIGLGGRATASLQVASHAAMSRATANFDAWACVQVRSEIPGFTAQTILGSPRKPLTTRRECCGCRRARSTRACCSRWSGCWETHLASHIAAGCA